MSYKIKQNSKMNTKKSIIVKPILSQNQISELSENDLLNQIDTIFKYYDSNQTNLFKMFLHFFLNLYKSTINKKLKNKNIFNNIKDVTFKYEKNK